MNTKRFNLKPSTLGIMYIFIAAFFFSLMTLFIRLAGDVPTFQKAFFRNAFAAVVAVIMLAKSDQKFRVKKEVFLFCFAEQDLE